MADADVAAAPAAEKEVKPSEFNLKKFGVVCQWSYSHKGDNTCAVDRMSIYELCISCQVSPDKREECKVAWGQCGHSFHYHCINEWLQKGRSVCPMCQQKWEFAKVE